MVLATSSANSKNSCQHQSVEAPCSLLITAFFAVLASWNESLPTDRGDKFEKRPSHICASGAVRGLSNTKGPNIHAVLHGAANRTVDNFALAHKHH